MAIFDKYRSLILVLILSLIAISPLFMPGFFPMHDDTQVARVYEMGKVLKTGVFPVRWVPDLGYGYGYPIFNFYAPLAYYVGGIFNVLGFDALVATKLMMIIGVLLAAITMYLLAKDLWGEWGGVLSAAAYVYAPYHALNIYVRGDVAEFWAYAFIPLAFYGFYKAYQSVNFSGHPRLDRGSKWVIIGAIGYAGVILSHNLTAMMITPFLLAFSLVLLFLSKNKLHALYCILYTLFLGALLSAFYWIPALTEMKYTNVLSQVGGGADFRDHFVCISQLWSSPWGFAGSTKGCQLDGMSFQIGKLHVGLFILSILFFCYSLFLNHKKKNLSAGQISLIIFSICSVVFSIFLMIDLSRNLWEFLKPMVFFQFPWRFLLVTLFFVSLAIGYIPYFLDKEIAGIKHDKYLIYAFILVISIVIVFFNSQLFVSQKILQVNSSHYTSDYAIKWVASKISDEYLPKEFKKPSSFSEVGKNPKPMPIPYGTTPIEQLSNILSLTGVLLCIVGIIYKRRHKA